MGRPHVQLDRVRAEDRLGDRGRPVGRIHGLSLALGAGIHAFLGRPEDGTYALHEVLTGARRPTGGRVLVAGDPPSSNASARASIASLGVRPALPAGRTVLEAVAFALAARGDAAPEAKAVLERAGCIALSARPLASLSLAERRAVDLAIVLSAPRPLVYVLHEPLLDAREAARATTLDTVREAAARGACVLVTTSSQAEVDELGAATIELHNGRLAPSSARASAIALEAVLAAPDASREGDAIRSLFVELSQCVSLEELRWSLDRAGNRAIVSFGGSDLEACASALFSAAARLDLAIVSLRALPSGARLARREQALRLESPGAQISGEGSTSSAEPSVSAPRQSSSDAASARSEPSAAAPEASTPREDPPT